MRFITFLIDILSQSDPDADSALEFLFISFLFWVKEAAVLEMEKPTSVHLMIK